MVTKVGMGHDVWDPYPCAKFHYDPIRGFCSPPLRASTGARIQSDSASFLGFCRRRTAKPCAPIFTINTSNDVLHKDVPLWVPKTAFYISTPIFPINC